MGTYYMWARHYWGQDVEPIAVEVDDAKLEAKRKSGSQLKVGPKGSHGRMVYPGQLHATKRDAWASRRDKLRTDVSAEERKLNGLKAELAQAEKEAERE